MADKVTLGIKIITDSKGVTTATVDVEELSKALVKVKKHTQGVSDSFKNLGQFVMSLDAISDLSNKLNDTVKALTQTYAAQEIAEARLGQVMRNTMGATDEEIQSIKDLCAAQQELGVIGDEVQIAGAQELGTYLEKTDSLKTLIPVMNDMVAQQYGLNASQESAVGIATMLGKVMEGQVGALSRYGYSFDEVEEQILKFGTEEEKVIVLSKVVGDSVGGMNEALAQTDSGKMQQLSNTFGDMKEKLGQMASAFAPMLDYITVAGDLVMSVGAISKSCMTAIPAIQAFGTALTANPVGAVVVGVVALGAALYALYENCEDFRDVVDEAWNELKELGTEVMDAASELYDSLKPALTVVWDILKGLGTFMVKYMVKYIGSLINGFVTLYKFLAERMSNVLKWIAEKFRGVSQAIFIVWNTAKKLFGIEEDCTTAIDNQTDSVEDQADAYDDLYASMQKTMAEAEKNKGNANKADKPSAQSGSLKALSADIQALQAKVELEVDPQKRAELYKELDKLKNLKLNIEAKMKLDAAGYTGEMDKMQASTVGISGALDSLSKGNSLSDMTKRHKKSLAQAVKDNEAYAKSQEELAKSQPTVADGLNATSNVIGSVAQAIGSLAGESKAAAVAQRALAIAGEAVALAGAISSATKGDPYTVAPRIAAAVAAVVAGFASFASLPKFANGGIISGPTIGLMGEYSGASNNPEVVAPLNKLKSMLGDVGGGMDGRVQFEIKGRKLVGVLARENSIRSRS